ncbi:hypothetical protein [Effusibacillus consociatus]|uniref:YtzI protein n=1 Tax=Effusibacillus consociatus TaxID=1117041 RepID=A0ABV9Q134_9BACL
MTAIGILLLAFTLALAIGIGRKANESVRKFDESQHESFVGIQNEKK